MTLIDPDILSKKEYTQSSQEPHDYLAPLRLKVFHSLKIKNTVCTVRILDPKIICKKVACFCVLSSTAVELKC